MVSFKLTGQTWPYIHGCSHQPTEILEIHLDPQIKGYSGPNGSGLAASSMLASAGNISAISSKSVVL